MALVGGPEGIELREPNSPLLVNIDDTKTEDIGANGTDTQNCDKANEVKSDTSAVNVTENPEQKLCGWLYVQTRGIIKTNRQRFCVFGDDSCKLYIYRNPHVILPLDEIDIARASFHFDASNSGRPGVFEIRSGGKEHVLDASDRHTMMYWLQELQTRRRTFNMLRNSLSRERLGEWKTKKTNYLSGLASNKDEINKAQRADIQSDLPLIKVPTPSVPNSLPLSSPEGTNSLLKVPTWSLTNLKSEIQGAFHNIKEQMFIDSGTPRKPSWSSFTPSPSPSQEDIVIVDPGEGHKSPSQQFNSVPKQNQKSKGGIMTGIRNKVMKKASVDGNTATDSTSTPAVCIKCKELRNQVRVLEDDNKATGEEVQATREILVLLQKELDKTKKEIESRQNSEHFDQDEYLELLSKRDKHIVELEYCLAATKKERELALQQVRAKDREIKTVGDQVTMYEDMLSAKDEIIVKLTHSLTEAEKTPDQWQTDDSQGDGTTADGPPVSPSLQAVIYSRNTKEIHQLKDICQAYQLQNQFLNREILELQELRKNEEDKMRTLMINFAQMEALFYQTRSKYLFLLKELKQREPVRGEDTKPQEVVNQLLQEALSESNMNEAQNLDYHLASSGQEFDRYGFVKKYFETEEELDIDPLVAKATQLEKQSTELTNKLKESDEVTSHLVKWENFMAGQTGKTLQRSAELKALVRSGVPYEYRSPIWKGCSNFYVGSTRDKLGPHYYKSLSSKAGIPTDPASKQIELDLLRTLPNNKHYDSADSEGISKLRSVLIAYSIHNPLVGYCQGLNRLAAIALLFVSEEEAFWMLVAIVEHIMPNDYFNKTLIAAQADQRVLKDLIQEKLPRVATHFDHHGVDLSLFTFNWFLTVFVDNIPPETFLRVWDAFLYEGSKVLFRFALAFFKEVEDEVLAANSALAINHLMRSIGEKMVNVRSIAQTAFSFINPFPMRSISSKRQFYLQQLKGELAELDKLRESLKTSRRSDYKDYCSDDDIDS